MDATRRVPARLTGDQSTCPEIDTGASAPLFSERLANFALLAWLGGVLLFGRTFSQIGISPVYLADTLAVTGTVLSIPRWAPSLAFRRVRALFLIAVTLFILVLQSVFRGVEAGYPAAMKSGCMGIYPLVAVAVAGLVARDPEIIHRFTRRVLPYVPIGFLLIALIEQFFIAAASALYLAYAAAWSMNPDGEKGIRRGLLVVGTLLAAGYLTAVGARRGPTVTILLASATTYVALRKQQRIRNPHLQPVAVVACCLSMALLAGTVLVLLNRETQTEPLDIPVFGSLAARVATTTESGTESGNNVILRWAMWRYAVGSTLDENPLFGRGAGHPIERNAGLFAKVDIRSGVHNSFVGYAFYSGFPSAFLVLLSLIIALVYSWRLRSAPDFAPMFGSIVAVVVTSMTNVALETPYIAGPAWAVVGAIVGLAAREDTTEAT